MRGVCYSHVEKQLLDVPSCIHEMCVCIKLTEPWWWHDEAKSKCYFCRYGAAPGDRKDTVANEWVSAAKQVKSRGNPIDILMPCLALLAFVLPEYFYNFSSVPCWRMPSGRLVSIEVTLLLLLIWENEDWGEVVPFQGETTDRTIATGCTVAVPFYFRQ